MLTSKPRILYVDHTLYRSGATISLGTLIANLRESIDPYFILRAGSEVEQTLHATYHQKYFERWLPQFMTAISIPQYSPILYIWHLFKIPLAFVHVSWAVRRWKIQLIHLNESTLIPYIFFGRILGLPVVMHARAKIGDRPIERFFLSWAASLRRVRFISVDEEVKESLPEKSQKTAQVIYNPVELGPQPRLQNVKKMRERWGVTDDELLIGQVGSLNTSMGIWEILEYASLLCPEYPKVKFVFVGDDRPQNSESQQLRVEIAHRGLGGKVVLAGYEEELSTVYGALDVVLCLFGERLGRVGRTVYEAALAGKPFIATLPNAGTSTTLNAGTIGMVFHPGNSEGILEALRILIESEEKRKKYGDRAKREIGNRHLPSFAASKVMELYVSLLKE